MDIMELGAIGELVGGLAVIGSLIFVGIQVRQAASASRAVVAHEAQMSAAAALEHLSGDPNRAALFLRGMGDLARIDPDEFPSFHFLAVSICRRFEAVMDHRDRGALDESTWEGQQNAVVGLVRMPGFRAWWAMAATLYNPNFRAFVRDAHALEQDPEWSIRVRAHMAAGASTAAVDEA